MPGPSRLAIVAHFDSRGGAARYFLRILDQLAEVADTVVVVSTALLSEEAAAAIQARATLFRRPNYGHDFGSWRDALERLDWASRYDELLLTNDSYVGFFAPIRDVFRDMEARDADVWGLTQTTRRGRHVQSYFINFTRAALHSQAFRRFWMDAKPAPDRMTAILEQEVGLSATLLANGFTMDSYFQPTVAERLRANARGIHWLFQRQRAFPARYDSLEEEFFSARRAYLPSEADMLNSSSAYADSVFDAGRLPVVKLDVLRNDPFWLGSDILLRHLERVHPAMLVGVRNHLAQMSADYGIRAYENHRYAHLTPPARLAVGYSSRKGALRLRPATSSNVKDSK